jgi:AraC family transcriptional regulator
MVVNIRGVLRRGECTDNSYSSQASQQYEEGVMALTAEASQFYGVRSAAWQQGGLRLSESTYPANLKMPAHAHEQAYLGIVLSGGYTERVGRKTRECKALTTIFHPRGEAHSVAFHNSRARIFRIEITAEWRASQYVKLPHEPAESDGGTLASLVLRLHNEFRLRDSWSGLAIEGLALEMMAELGRSCAKKSDRLAPAWLDEVRQSLASRITETPTLAELASSAGVHPVHLAREFRKHFRCTIGDFIRRVRVEFACHQIAETDAPLSEVALAAGFYDQSHFSNVFRRFTGTTPAAYRMICRAS